jgi:hypothetical protein
MWGLLRSQTASVIFHPDTTVWNHIIFLAQCPGNYDTNPREYVDTSQQCQRDSVASNPYRMIFCRSCPFSLHTTGREGMPASFLYVAIVPSRNGLYNIPFTEGPGRPPGGGKDQDPAIKNPHEAETSHQNNENAALSTQFPYAALSYEGSLENPYLQISSIISGVFLSIRYRFTKYWIPIPANAQMSPPTVPYSM